jgi:mannosyltransferase
VTAESRSPRPTFGAATVLVTNLHRRFTGVSATVRALVPLQQERRTVAVLDTGALGLAGRVSLGVVLRLGWRPPPGHATRILHARRDVEMLLGVVLRDVLRQPWKLVFTSDAPKRPGAVLRALVRRMDTVIATSPRVAAFLEREAAIVPHGVDTDVFTPPPSKSEAWRASGLPGRHGIGAFGRIRPDKGTDLFVSAMCALLPRHPDFTAVLTGHCKREHRAFKARLSAEIAAAGLSERIVFLGDLGEAEIRAWYRRVALCVAASRSEGFGLTPLEAMASGAAAVASRTGAHPTVIREGETGALFDPGDRAGLVRALEPLLQDPTRLADLGARARRHVVEHHSIRDVARGIVAQYAALLASPPGS